MRFTAVFTIAALAACSSSTKPTLTGEGGAGATCANPVALGDTDYCKSCTVSPAASPSTCEDNRPLNACCAWVQEPKAEAARATNLHYFSAAGDTTVDVGC